MVGVAEEELKNQHFLVARVASLLERYNPAPMKVINSFVIYIEGIFTQESTFLV